jgi:16S rRNA pseudouridine516 synthase
MRLDRLLKSRAQIGRRQARDHLAAGRVLVNDRIERHGNRLLYPFDHIVLAGQTLRRQQPRYLILHKPAGHVSATKDPQHPTVIDLITESWARELHLAGRLDRFTTGLVILTNDSRFSEALTQPERHVPKTYLVQTAQPIPAHAITAFREGMFFAKENITTHPAIVEPHNDHSCRLTIFEGKHHQIKRMFARFDIKLTNLHRESIGPLSLDKNLLPGSYRPLSPTEHQSLTPDT